MQNRAALLALDNMPELLMFLRALPIATLAPAALLPAMFRLRKFKVRRALFTPSVPPPLLTGQGLQSSVIEQLHVAAEHEYEVQQQQRAAKSAARAAASAAAS